jgi:hypothetical protein
MSEIYVNFFTTERDYRGDNILTSSEINLLMLNTNSGAHFPETTQLNTVNSHLNKGDFLDQPNDHEL